MLRIYLALYYLQNRFYVNVSVGKVEGGDFQWQKSMRRNVLSVGICRIESHLVCSGSEVRGKLR